MTTPTHKLAWCRMVVAELEKAMAAATHGPRTAHENVFACGELKGTFIRVGTKEIASASARALGSQTECAANARLICAAHAALPEYIRMLKSDIETADMTCRKGDARFVALVVEKVAPIAKALGLPPCEEWKP